MASQKNSYREKIRETNPFDPPQENVRPAPPKTPNFVGAVEITKPSGKVTSSGGGNFPSKYPQLLASIGSVVNDFHKTFTEKESYAAVDVSHVITNNNAVGNFCTYLIDGSSDSISADTNWRSFTIKKELAVISIYPRQSPLWVQPVRIPHKWQAHSVLRLFFHASRQPCNAR